MQQQVVEYRSRGGTMLVLNTLARIQNLNAQDNTPIVCR